MHHSGQFLGAIDMTMIQNAKMLLPVGSMGSELLGLGIYVFPNQHKFPQHHGCERQIAFRGYTWDNMRSNSLSHRVFRAKHTHSRENTCHNARLAADNLDNVNSRATVAVQVQQ